VRVKDTVSRHEFSLQERCDYWLDHHEFGMIKQRNQRAIQAVLVRNLESSQSLSTTKDENNHNSCTQHSASKPLPTTDEEENEDCCLRGLESGFPNENLRKRSYRFAALEEVFLEQEDQYFAGIYDDEAIAEIYYQVTVECRFRAEFRAIQDRKEIEDYLQEGQQQQLQEQWAIICTVPTTTPKVALDEDEDEFAI
jgi:hypothetical protein